MENDFTIIKAYWLTKKARNGEFDKKLVYQYFMSFFTFLQKNKLVKKDIVLPIEEINDETKLLRSDLTNEGFEFFKIAHDRWANNIFDKGKSPEDVKYLEKKLKEIREK
jgi:hypothetical protein